VGQRAAAAGRPGGGAGIQALRPARARLITGLGALLALGGACVYAAATAGRLAPITIVTGSLAVALLALGIVLRWPSMIPWTIVLSGAGYLAAREGTELVDGWAAAIGVLLLLAAELAAWSIDHDARIRSEPSLAIRRAATIGALCVGALLVNVMLLGTAGVAASAGVLLAAVGVAAAVTAVAIVLRLVRA
jgi:hypothetical protein